MKRSKNTASYTIEELFKKNSQKTIHQDQPDDEDDLLLALRLSEQEQVNEQRRLLEQFSQLSQRSISKQNAKAKKRAIQPLEEEKEKEDEDQWFQTVSSRPQPAYKILKQKNKTLESKKRIEKKLPLRHNKDTEETSLLKPVKTEKDNDEIVLDIDDMSEWLQAKEEPEQAEEDDLVIEDMSEWLRAKDEPDTEPDLIIDDMSEWLRVKEEDEPEITSIPTVEEVEMPCPLCQQLFKQGTVLEKHAAMCNDMLSDSDCSVIDLVEQTEAADPMTIDDKEEEDGYLSPLEGFTNLKDNRDNQAFGQYFAQLQPPPVQKRKRATSAPRKKKRFFKRKKKDILKSTKA